MRHRSEPPQRRRQAGNGAADMVVSERQQVRERIAAVLVAVFVGMRGIGCRCFGGGLCGPAGSSLVVPSFRMGMLMLMLVTMRLRRRAR